ncbi:hypothetical protein RHSIM_Rhsim12G0155100 [Rhododendron simsii]|uniref:YGL010w-like protein n=1 Tax=Rhododendron simsii TaxID=118357 RepID=A0A834G2Z0_RHOSS|nr:hypothetical protein RHSIM_Rhsim12G0155100 [Rhododendron simsii]
MGRKMELFDLEKHFAFYGAYHSNPVNSLIHILFVWPIFFTTLILLYFTPAFFFGFPFDQFPLGLVPNYGFLVSLIYASLYAFMDKKAGPLAAILCLACWVSASLVAKHLGFPLALKVVVAAQLFCWTGQIIGHGVFEKRVAALPENLTQTFLMEPFYVLLEALQLVFGYEPYPGFDATVKAKRDAEIKKLQEKKEKKIE